MKANLAGLLISTSVHLGLFLLIIYGLSAKPAPYTLEQIVPLQLTSFQPATPIARPAPVAKKKPILKPAIKHPIKQHSVKHLAKKPPRIIRKKRKKHSRAKIKPRTRPLPATRPARKIIRQTVATQLISQSINSVTVEHKLPQPASHNNIQLIEQQYTLHLRNLIARQKKYPRRAKHRHEEGTVMVSFTIYADGHIQNIEVKQKSGSYLLDQNAIDTIRRISGRLPFPDKIKRKQWRFTLPLIYHLR